MHGSWRVIVCLALLLAVSMGRANQPLLGSPPVERYAHDLDVFPQNFAVVQDARGITYLGNTDGVLEFDGERWRLLRLPNREMVRSLAVAKDGRLLVGGYNIFGYALRDEVGQLQFHDLTPRFRKALSDREFADIWDVLVAPEGVYFRGLRHVFFWDPATGTSAHWYHEGRFGVIKHHAGTTFLQFRGEGIRRRDGDGWTLLPGTTSLSTLVGQLLPLPDGSLLTMGSSGEWRRLADGKVLDVSMPPGMPPSNKFQRGLVLADGSLALTAIDGQVYIVDPELKGERHFRLDPGFISGIAPATTGQGFLVSGDQAFYRIAWPANWIVLGAEHGATGGLLGIAEWNRTLYLTLYSGVLAMRQPQGGVPYVEQMPWKTQGVYDMFGLGPDRVLLASDHHVVVVESDKERKLSEELVYPRMFKQSVFHPGRIYVGTEAGLRLIIVDGNRLSLKAALQTELSMLVTNLAETSAREVWVGTARHGLWRYKLSVDGRALESRRFAEPDGLPTGPIASVDVQLPAGGKLLASTAKGLFEFDGQRFSPASVNGLAALRQPDELLRLRETGNSEQWAFGTTRLFHRPAGMAWREEDIRSLRRGAIGQAHFDVSGRAMFLVGESVLLRGDANHERAASAPRVQLRQVTRLLPDGQREALPLSPTSPVRMGTRDFGIEFQFALPELEREGSARYQGRLLGYETEYSEWSKSHGYTYSRLSPGKYQLQVRAMDTQGRITSITPYRLVIEPRWYATLWAKLAAVLLLAIALWLLTLRIIWARTRRIADEKLKLKSTVESRTRELADANRRLEMMANVDGLTGIANRRRLDEYLAVVWEQCRERSRPLSVLAIDVDHFKQYNDRYGHPAGDELLKQLVLRLANCLRRAEDLLARYGGEEFMVVLPGTDIIVAHGIAEAMRQTLEASDVGITISVGVASCIPGAGEVVTKVVEQADAALYGAKGAGRNRVEIHKST